MDEGFEDGIDPVDVHAWSVVADAGLHMDVAALDPGLQPGLDHAVAGELQRIADQVVEHLFQTHAVDHGRQVGVALVADQQGDAVLRGAGFPHRLNIVHHGAQSRRRAGQLQFARLGLGQVHRVLQDAQQGLGRIHDGLDVRLGGRR